MNNIKPLPEYMKIGNDYFKPTEIIDCMMGAGITLLCETSMVEYRPYQFTTCRSKIYQLTLDEYNSSVEISKSEYNAEAVLMYFKYIKYIETVERSMTIGSAYVVPSEYCGARQIVEDTIIGFNNPGLSISFNNRILKLLMNKDSI